MNTLPHSIEAERAVLGSVLIRPSLFAELDGGLLGTDDFLNVAHRETWDAMRSCDPLDTLTLFEAMTSRGTLSRYENGVVDLAALSGAVPTAENARHYARIVREKAVLRRLIALCLETVRSASGDCDLAEVLTETRSGLDRLEVPTDNGPVRVGDALEEAEEAIEARESNKSSGGVLSGLRGLDRWVGGFKPGQQIVIAANPGGGKSAFAWSTAIRAAMDGVPALCFSLEMKRQEMVERAITFVGEVPGLATGSKEDPLRWEKIRGASRKLRPLPVWVDDRKLSIGRIGAEARRWRSRHARDGMALLVVDYLGLVRSDSSAENRQLEVASMSRAFKQLAGDLNCPLILVAQLNRQNMAGGMPRQPVLSDLRDSGAIEQDADIVLFPWRDGADTQLIIAKHRNGRVGKINVKWRGELMAFYNVDNANDFDEEESR